MSFKDNLTALKKLNLPTSDFVVVSSGALAVRGICDARDLDVVVSDELWEELISKYKVKINEFGIKTVELENEIEILDPAGSLYGNQGGIPMKTIFEKADIFEGIKFINLNHLKTIKLEVGREKDLHDVKLIDDYLKNENN